VKQVQAKTKRIIIFSVLIGLLVLSGYLNYAFNNTGDQAASSDDLQAPVSDSQQEEELNVSSATFFSDFRLDRDRVRTKELEYIDSILADNSVDNASLQAATEQKLALADSMEKEVTIEGLLKAKGFTDAVVTLHKGSVNVVIDSAELTKQQAAQILDIVMRESGESSENIKIMPKN
jgi:stage III sporulation protein AH